MFWKFTYRSQWLPAIADLLADPAVQSMRALPQHRKGFSCYLHSLWVSYVSFSLCRRLGWHAEEAARGGLLHDLYLYDWTDRHLCSAAAHLKDHPRIALQNASERFLLTPRERDIIAAHMFPPHPTPYHFRESFAVSCADKLCALLELADILPRGLDVPYVPAGSRPDGAEALYQIM